MTINLNYISEIRFVQQPHAIQLLYRDIDLLMMERLSSQE